GETLREHIKRIRLERSALRLLTAGDVSATDVAFSCGFSSSQSFTRAFKAHYGIPPTRLRPNVGRAFIFSKKWQNMETGYGRKYLLPKEVRPAGAFIQIPCRTSAGKDFMQDLEVVDMPAMRVACVRTVAHPGSDEFIQAKYRLAAWALSRRLFTGDARWFSAIGILPDEEGRVTCDTSLSVPEGIEADEESGVNIWYLPAGEYGVYHAKFSSVAEILETWKRLIYGGWISSYCCRERRPLYELYYNNPDMQLTWTLIADLCLPITTRRTK
ncbi:MAG TPA: helix-turn-helix domain-containing protein, partial [Smithellaceae bacterium]|nr:helix-turn-helix domain-containing protein [Smithellaceae bacterium]